MTTTGSAAFEELLGQLVDEATHTIHHGKPGLPAAAKRRFARRFEQVIPAGDLGAVDVLLTHALAAVREVGACLLTLGVYPEAEVETRARTLALDEDWEVREWAVDPYRKTLGQDPIPGLQEWISAGGRLRRAAVLAIRSLVLDGSLSASDSLSLLEVVIDDADVYVQANVGGFLIGDALLRRYPTETAAFLKTRVETGRVSRTFWKNVADALRSAGARANQDVIGEVLGVWTREALPKPVLSGLGRLLKRGEFDA